MNSLPRDGKIRSDYKGIPVFQVSDSDFKTSSRKKKKFEKWGSFFDEDSDFISDVKKYSLRNPNSHVIIQNSENGEMKLLRRRYNDMRLKHNRNIGECTVMPFREFLEEKKSYGIGMRIIKNPSHKQSVKFISNECRKNQATWIITERALGHGLYLADSSKYDSMDILASVVGMPIGTFKEVYDEYQHLIKCEGLAWIDSSQINKKKPKVLTFTRWGEEYKSESDKLFVRAFGDDDRMSAGDADYVDLKINSILNRRRRKKSG